MNATLHTKGIEGRIINPSTAESEIEDKSFFVTSLFAQGDSSHGIQAGVTGEWELEEDACDLGTSGQALYYFEEVLTGGNGQCWADGSATYNDANLFRLKTYDSKWYAYMDSGSGYSYLGHSTLWDACNGEACSIAAFGEFKGFAREDGKWRSKFGSTDSSGALYYFNGNDWSTQFVVDSNAHYDTKPYPSPWSSTYSGDPSKVWWFCYGGSC